MKPLNYWILLAIISGVAVFNYFLTQMVLLNAGTPIWINPLLSILLLLFSVPLWLAGQAVKRLKKRKATWLSVSSAPYVAALAQAVAYYCAIQLGYVLAQLAMFITWWNTNLPHRFLATVIFSVIATVILLTVALIVEKWCRVDMSDDPDKTRLEHQDHQLLTGSGCTVSN